MQVAVRELRAHLSHWLACVEQGQEVIVTSRGTPVARLSGLRAEEDPLDQMIAAGLVRPPTRPRRRLPPRLKTEGDLGVTDLLAEQRR